jgi:molybdate transport system ATP-binding protein
LDGPGLTLDVAFDKRIGDFHLRARFAVGRELLVLFGHSGSGKSLTLKAIAGLLRPDAGRIAIGGVPVFDAARGIDVPPQQRGVGMVVQSYALFPHLTVRDNIAFGLDRLPKAERRARVDALLGLLGIAELAERRPEQISGGQAQRVALARALAPRPRLLLLDEPFSALDSAIRVGLRRELVRMKRELDLTIVFVTHDLREAHNLADRVAVFDRGQVLQTGTRDEVFERPASARVAELTEVRNIWHGRVLDAGEGGTVIDVGAMTMRVSASLAPGTEVDLGIRPERVLLLRPDRPEGEGLRDTLVTADIVDEIAHGASYTLFFRVDGGARTDGYDVEVDVPAHPYEVLGVRRRRTWTLMFPRDALHVMAAEHE